MERRKVNIVLSCLFWILIIAGYPAYSCYSNYQDRKDAERKKERAAFVKDSIMHTKEYIDSVEQAEIRHKAWKVLNDSLTNAEIIGFIYDGDSVFHDVFHDVMKRKDGWYHKYLASELQHLRFVTKKEADKKSYKYCEECESILDVYSQYENGEIINIDNIKDYILENSEEFEDYFINEPEEDDDYRWHI